MGVPTVVKKLPPLAWLMIALALVAVMPSAKAPTGAQSVISDPNPRPVLWNGTGSPPGTTGVAGDFWIDRNAMAIYGPKTGPSTWPGPFSMVGPTGAAGPAGPTTVGVPNTRSLSLATAYQATDNTKPSIVTINLTSTANISLSGGTTNTASIYMGSTNAVASGTGTLMCPYSNSNTGTLTIGLNLSTVATTSCTMLVPAGWWFSVLQTAGTVTITSARDQSLG